VLCRSLFVLFSPLYCLSFDLLLQIIPLVSSSFSFLILKKAVYRIYDFVVYICSCFKDLFLCVRCKDISEVPVSVNSAFKTNHANSCWHKSVLTLTSKNICELHGRIQDFKIGGVHLKKMRRAEGGAKILDPILGGCARSWVRAPIGSNQRL
jgi:hypothetical protein